MNKPLHKILVRPLLTEKSVRGTTTGKGHERIQYVFEVTMDATKPEIARAIEEYYVKDKVAVDTVRTMHMRGRQRRMSLKRGRRASTGLTPAWKKAIVTLKADSPNIPLMENI